LNRQLQLASASALVIAALAAVGPALAQDNSDDSTSGIDQLNNIVVTATRQATKLQETPISVTAVTSAQLEARSIETTADLSSIVPNAEFRTSQGAYGKGVTAFIRGIGQIDTNLASEPAVAYYIDDVYYPLLFGSQFDLLDLDHVEVLRGPQGTLFGRNALAGAVNIVSKAPDLDEATGEFKVTTGDFSRLDLRGGINLPLGDNLAIRINGSSKHRQGYEDKLDFRCEMIRRGTPQLAGNFPYSDGILIQAPNFTPDDCVTGHLGGENINAARASALWKPTSRLAVTLTGDYTDDKSENQADQLVDINPNAVATAAGSSHPNITAVERYFGLTPQAGNYSALDNRFITGSPYQTYATYGDPLPAGINLDALGFYPGNPAVPNEGFYNGSVLRGGLRYPTTSPILNWGVSTKAVYDLGVDDMQVTMVGGYRYVDTLFGFDVDGTPIGLEQTRNNTGQNDWTGEARFTGSVDLLDWAVGFFYYKGDGYVHTTLVSPWLGQQRYQNHKYQPESQAYYGNFVIKPTDRFHVTLGGRFSDDRKLVHYNNLLDGDTTGASAIQFLVKPKDNRFDWKAGVDYKLFEEGNGILEDTMLFASASTGFRLPSFNARPFQPSQVTQIDGDETRAYELGVKTDLLDHKVRANLTGFYTDYLSRPLPVAGSEYLLDASGNPVPLAGGQVTEPLPNGPPGSTRCRTRTAAEVTAGVQGYQCVSRNYYMNTPGTVSGFEAEIDAEPIDRLLFNFSAGYSKFSAPDVDNRAINPGKVVGIPDWTANAGVQYELEAPKLGGTITPRLDWVYQGDMIYSTASTKFNQPAYSVVNARLTYYNKKHDATISIGATNLFDTFYYENFFILQDFGYPQTDAQPSPPREWYLEIGKKF
jgi:iron complex outermembrane receptor protein